MGVMSGWHDIKRNNKANRHDIPFPLTLPLMHVVSSGGMRNQEMYPPERETT